MTVSTEISIDTLLDRQPLRRRQAMLVAALLLVFFFDNFCLQTLSLAAPLMIRAWGVTAAAMAGAMAAGWLGAAFGSLAGGVLGDRIGRRPTLFAATGIACAATLATVLARGPGDVVVLRILAGLGIGGTFPPLIALGTECLPTARRGQLVSVTMLCGPLGIMACAIVATAMGGGAPWQRLFLTGGAALLVAGVLLAMVAVESPRYLAGQPDRRTDLSRALRRLGIPLDPGTEIAMPQRAAKASPGEVLSPALRGTTLRLWASMGAVYLAVSAVLNWLPTILATLGYPPAIGGQGIAAWSVGGIACTLFAGWSIGRWGTRIMARAFAVAACCSLAALAIAPLGPAAGPLVLLVPMAGVGGALSGLLTALYAFAAELYPAAIRSSGVGIIDTIGRAASVLAAFATIFVLDAVSTGVFFGIGALAALLPALLLIAGRDRAA